MTFLEDVVRDGLCSLPDAQHDDFRAALRHSLTVEPATYSPRSFDPFGFSQRELYDLRVLLLRPLALEFVQAHGSDISKSRFDRRTTYDAYERRFGRQPWLISSRPRIMLLTYTEWIALALDEPQPLALPASLFS